MNLTRKAILASLLLALSGCNAGGLGSLDAMSQGQAAVYQPYTNGQGYHEIQLSQDQWRVSFTATTATSAETIQAYWLYRSAKLALEKGYDGFVLTQTMQFVLKGEKAPRIQLAMAGHPGVVPIFIPGGGGGVPPRYTTFEGAIRLVNAPLTQAPPNGFDARRLVSQLDKIMSLPTCMNGNICPHEHTYLQP